MDLTQLYRLENAGRWGIATMVGAAVGAAVNTFNHCQPALAHLSPNPTQPGETHSVDGGDRILKILVSAVQFRTGPPPKS